MSENKNTIERQPFFYDVTLRDGNQALPKPWNNAQKKDVYLQLLKLGVQGAEVGFPASSLRIRVSTPSLPQARSLWNMCCT